MVEENVETVQNDQKFVYGIVKAAKQKKQDGIHSMDNNKWPKTKSGNKM